MLTPDQVPKTSRELAYGRYLESQNPPRDSVERQARLVEPQIIEAKQSVFGEVMSVLGAGTQVLGQMADAHRAERVWNEHLKDKDEAAARQHWEAQNAWHSQNAEHTQDDHAYELFLQSGMESDDEHIKARSGNELASIYNSRGVAAERSANKQAELYNKQKRDAENLVKDVVPQIRNLRIGPPDKVPNPMSVESVQNSGLGEAELAISLNDAILKSASDAGMTLEVDGAGMITDPFILNELKLQARTLNSEQVRNNSEYIYEQNQKQLTLDIDILANASTDPFSMLGNAHEAMYLIGKNAPKDKIPSMTEGYFNKAASNISNQIMSKQLPIDSGMAVLNELGKIGASTPAMGGAMTEVIDKQKKAILEFVGNDVEAGIKKAAAPDATLGLVSSYLMEKTPTGEHLVDRLLAQQAKNLGFKMVGQGLSLGDVDSSNLSKDQAALLNELKKTRNQIQADATDEGWTPKAPTQKDAMGMWLGTKRNPNLMMTETQLNEAYNKGSFAKGIQSLDLTDDQMSQLQAEASKSGINIPDKHTLMYAMQNGQTPIAVIEAAARLDASKAIESGMMPSSMADDLQDRLRKGEQNDLISVSSTIAKLGGSQSGMVLESKMDWRDRMLMDKLLSFQSQAGTDRANVNWYTDYLTYRDQVLATDVSSDGKTPLDKRLLGGKTVDVQFANLFKKKFDTSDVLNIAISPSMKNQFMATAMNKIMENGALNTEAIWDATAKDFEKQGVKFVREGNTVTTFRDTIGHSNFIPITASVWGGGDTTELKTQPQKVAYFLNGKVLDNKSDTYKAAFGVPPETNTKDWSAYDFAIYRLKDQIGAKTIQDVDVQVDFLRAGDNMNRPADINNPKDRRFQDVWQGGGGVIKIRPKNAVEGTPWIVLKDKQGNPMTYSEKRGAFQTGYNIQKPAPVTPGFQGYTTYN